MPGKSVRELEALLLFTAVTPSRHCNSMETLFHRIFYPPRLLRLFCQAKTAGHKQASHFVYTPPSVPTMLTTANSATPVPN